VRKLNSNLEKNQKDIIHLLNRATFGPSGKELKYFQNLSVKEAVDKLFIDSEFWVKLDTVPDHLYTFRPNRGLELKERLKLRREIRACKQQLNFDWLNELVYSPAQLRERMAFFWHDHFACNVDSAAMHQKQINSIREHSLEYFGDLVVNIAKDPGMIVYLNGNKNVKDNPNENFGRELLELFTIGIGNYSEEDIKEASRAFTGYKFDPDGNFYVETKLQDKGLKTFMGNEDYFNAEDIMNLIFQNPKTGHYIISKIYFYFIGREIEKDRLKTLGDVFFKSGYHIGTLLREIFSADWFYSSENRGIKIKSPIELIAGIMRITQLKFNNASVTLDIQRKLGQALFYPPNVSGWVNGRNWLDLASLADRLNLTKKLLRKSQKVSQIKKQITQEDLDIIIEDSEKLTTIEYDISILQNYISESAENSDADLLAEILFSVDFEHLGFLLKNLDKRIKSKPAQFKNALISLMSQPEYQLC